MTAPDPGPRVLPWPPRPPRRVLGIPVGLLVCWQVALLLALVAIGRPAGTVIGLGVAAAAVVAATGWRPGGRWAHEWALLWLRFRARQQRLASSRPRPPEPELALLALAAAGTAVEVDIAAGTAVEVDADHRPVAVISHRTGCAAVLELATAGSDAGAAALALPLALVPAPDRDAPAVSVQLLACHGGDPADPPRTWLAVQVRREPGYTPAELRAALAGAVRRLQRRLRPEGLVAQPLDRSRLLPALRTLSFLDLAAPAGTDPGGTERWHTWWTGRVAQRSLAVRSWPGLPAAPGRAVFGALLERNGPGTVSIAARRQRLPAAHGALRAGDEVVAMELLVRLTGPDQAALAAAVGRLGERLAAAGAGVESLDGRQLPALAGTLPLGGFLPGYPPAAAAFAPPPAVVPAPASQPGGPPEPAAAPPSLATAPGTGSSPAPSPADAADPLVATTPPVPVPAVTAGSSRSPGGTAGALAGTDGGALPAPRTAPVAEAPPAHGPAPAGPAPGRPEAREPARAWGQVPVRAALTGRFAARGQAPVPAGPAAPVTTGEPPPDRSAARGQAQVPVALTGPSPARGQAAVTPPGPADQPSTAPGSAPPASLSPAASTTADMPTALPGIARPGPVPDTEAGPGTGPGDGPGHLPYPGAPDPHRAVRAYGTSLFTAESPDRAQVDRLVALARAPLAGPQVVSVVAGRPGLGASVTAAAVARTLATVRDDHTALLGGATGPVDGATIAEVVREHAFTIVDLGAHPGEETPLALAASTRVLVVAGADRRATAATRLVLERVHQVHPALTAHAVVAVVCRTGKQYRRVSRELSQDHSPQAAQIVPVPPDPAVHQADHVDLTRLRTGTRAAYLRLAAALAVPAAAGGTAGAGALAGPVPTHP